MRIYAITLLHPKRSFMGEDGAFGKCHDLVLVDILLNTNPAFVFDPAPVQYQSP
jgi:hypothetical protein